MTREIGALYEKLNPDTEVRALFSAASYRCSTCPDIPLINLGIRVKISGDMEMSRLWACLSI
jgi:hypothetical protein